MAGSHQQQGHQNAAAAKRRDHGSVPGSLVADQP
jgi:hypothetical protein